MSALVTAIRTLFASPATMGRLLLLFVLWGLCVFGWGTLGDYAIQQRVPAVLASTARAAQEMDTFFADRLALLDTLAADSRIPQSLPTLEGIDNQNVRRALYEFSYINRLPQVYIWHGATGKLTRPATAEAPSDDVRAWLVSLAGQDRGLFVDSLDRKPAAYLATRITSVNDGSAYAILRQSWPFLLAGLPVEAEVNGFKGATYGLLTIRNGKVWWAGSPAGADAHMMDVPSRLMEMDADYLPLADGSVVVAAKLLRFERWATAALLPGAAAVGETMRNIQWGLLAATLLATLVILWRPSLPLRRRVAATAAPLTDKLAPAFQPFAPLAAKMQAVIRGEKSDGGTPLAEPGTFSKEDFEPVRRGKGMSSNALRPTRLKSTLEHSAAALPSAGASGGTVTPQEAPSTQAIADKMAPKTSRSVAQSSMAKMIETCINTDRTRLLYQPVYRANDGVPVMHEVYLRLLDDDGQEVSPATFFPVADQLGWTPRLDAHVFQRLMQLHFGNGNLPSTPLAINLSGTTMESLGYLEMLMNMGNSPIMSHLVFEVRSQELMKDPHAMRFLHECQEMGVKLTVDYFGGGAGMVEASKRLGFDYVKMDAMRFGKSDVTKKELINLCRTAQRVGLPVILEKVENVGMEVFARRTAIPFLQGYLFAKPIDQLVTGSMPGWRTVGQESAAQPASDAVASPAPSADATAAPPEPAAASPSAGA